MAKTLLCAMLLLAISGAPAHAQSEVQTGFAIGASSISPEMGLHALLKAELAATPAVRLRLESMFQQLRGNALFGLGSVVFSPFRRGVAPYVLGSAGIVLNEGDFTWGIGIGADVDTPDGIPLFVEFRGFLEPLTTEFVTASLGVRF